jgi:hypothetical protein
MKAIDPLGEEPMKRLIGVVSGAALLTVVFAQTAFAAKCGEYPASPCDAPTVLPTVVQQGGGTAFTGANLGMGFIAVTALVVVGLVALFAARKRAARAAS